MSNLSTLSKYVGTLKSLLVDYQQFTGTLVQEAGNERYQKRIEQIRETEAKSKLPFILGRVIN